MKIKGITGPLRTQKNAQAAATETEPTFARMLDEAKGKLSSPASAVSIQGIDPMAVSEHLPPGPHAVLERAAHLLDLMDDFAQGLGNPNKSLRSLEPIVRQMEKDVKDLESSSKEQNQGLAKITQEIAMTAHIEAMKFDRGDYV